MCRYVCVLCLCVYGGVLSSVVGHEESSRSPLSMLTGAEDHAAEEVLHAGVAGLHGAHPHQLGHRYVLPSPVPFACSLYKQHDTGSLFQLPVWSVYPLTHHPTNPAQPNSHTGPPASHPTINQLAQYNPTLLITNQQVRRRPGPLGSSASCTTPPPWRTRPRKVCTVGWSIDGMCTGRSMEGPKV